jgi:NAD(P)-dependent dehydrogenase (short-subunit alcohol dehydrogenase family)
MLKNQNIVVFGAAGMLGGHFLKKALRLGANCVAVDLRPTKGGAKYFKCDVTSLDEVTEVADQVFDTFSHVDNVLNFTGVHHEPMDFFRDDHKKLMEDFHRVMHVNTTGAFVLTMVFAKKMISRRHGQIIHLCSNGSRLSLYGSYAYNASKHGIEGLIKTAAAQLAPFNVRVNGVAPGTVETPLNRQLLRKENGKHFSSRAFSILAHTPSKKFATLEGITETIIAMCLPQRHFTGNIVFCDDGYNIEGHSWPEGNQALFTDISELDKLFRSLDKDYPID